MGRLALAAAVLALLGAATPAAAKPAYTTTPAPTNSEAAFVVKYNGSGSYGTTYHATPPNQGGKPDTNDAHDTSTQAWNIRFRRKLVMPTCGRPQSFGDDPCTSLAGLYGASGPTNMTGKVNHKHVDGPYRQLNRSVKCTLRKSPSPKRTLDVTLATRYIPESQSIGVSVSDPLSTTLSLFPMQCPKQGDSIDRIADFYATPGFSFADFYGPDRWFASREIVIPASVFHRSARITIPLRLTANGTPPKRCAVRNPSYERCKTGGAWKGVLTLTLRQPAAKRAAKATATAAAARKPPAVKAPKSGQYNGHPRGKDLALYISGKSIQLAAISFKCADTEGRTSLNDIRLKKTSRGYKFALDAHGSITFADDQTDENGKVAISGRFTRSGRKATGVFRVRSPRCGDTGNVKWSARR